MKVNLNFSKEDIDDILRCNGYVFEDVDVAYFKYGDFYTHGSNREFPAIPEGAYKKTLVYKQGERPSYFDNQPLTGIDSNNEIEVVINNIITERLKTVLCS